MNSEPLTPQKFEELKAKRRPLDPNKEQPVWMDYDKSCEILQQGIPAIKYNFSNDGHRKVILKLNEARTHLIYESE